MSKSILPLVRRLSIESKYSGLVRFEPNWAQQEFFETIDRQRANNKPVRIVTLKARQLGISTASEAAMFCAAITQEGSHGLVIAHETDISDHLMGMTRLFYDTFPYRSLYTARYLSRREIAFKETGSSLRIATAANMKVARGRTIQNAHLSETAFWDHPETIMLGLRQAIPQHKDTMILLESTANGVGNWFYDTWQAAVDNEIEFEPLFFPWWKEPTYTASFIGLPTSMIAMTGEERAMKRMGIDDDHLAWRRWAITNLADGNEESFSQEYPHTAESAFLASGTMVFPHEKLLGCYAHEEGARGMLQRDSDRVKFVPDRLGPLRVFRKPSAIRDHGKYFVAGDPTSTMHGDGSCAQVINRRTYEQVAVWHGRIDPVTFATVLADIGKWYNDAEIVTESTGPGYATIGALVANGYPNIWRSQVADKAPGKPAEMLGWSTNVKRKEWAVGYLLKLVIDGSLVIHDRRTYDEMRNYVSLPEGGYGPAEDRKGGYDDTVMALAIGCICNATTGPLMPYEGDDPTRHLRELMQEGGVMAPDARPGWESWGEESA